MDLEILQKAKALETCIEAVNKNIENLSLFKDCGEIMIIANTSKAQEAIKGIYYDRNTGNLPPVYYSGKDKDAIIDTVLNKYRAFRNEKLKQLNEL
jgi:hypothetical protein